MTSTTTRPHARGSRIFTWLFLLFFVVVIGFAFFVLYKKSKTKPVVFQTESAEVTDLTKKTVATGSIVPRQEVEHVLAVLLPLVRGQALAEDRNMIIVFSAGNSGNGENTITGVLYRDDPTIFGWELMNEAQVITGRWAERRAWFAEMSAYLKSLDVEQCGKSRIPLNGGVQELHIGNLMALLEQNLRRENTLKQANSVG